MPPPQTGRVEVLDAYVLRHVMAHPARGIPWTVRELSDQVEWHRVSLGHITSGARKSLPAAVANRIAEAVGCHPATLFTPWATTSSVDKDI
jgi:hypothetical protein